MGMNYKELDELLGEQLKKVSKTNTDEMKGSERENIYKQSEYIAKLAKQKINLADILVRINSNKITLEQMQDYIK